MIQTVYRSDREIDGSISHYIWAYDNNGEIIDIVEIGEDEGRVTCCHSIIKR